MTAEYDQAKGERRIREYGLGEKRENFLETKKKELLDGIVENKILSK